MSDRDLWGVEETTTSKRRRANSSGGNVSVRVIAEDRVSLHELPDAGEVCLGRGADAHITVPMLDVSRRHAMLRIGERIELCDLGSANGTILKGSPLEDDDWHEIQFGDWFCLGDATVVLAEGPMRTLPSRSVGREAFFEAFDDLVSKYRRIGIEFSVATIRCVTTRNWVDVIQAMLGTSDHLAVLGDALVSILMPERDAKEAELLVQAVAEHLERIGSRPSVTIRRCPQDGFEVEELVPKLRKEQATKAATMRPPDPLAKSEAMVAIYQLVDEVAPSMTSILILGETGVGKEVLARAIHDRSPRRSKSFLAINCAALSENLLESELFGYERGAFTGAVASKAGLLETAEGGTVFLDELGEMPSSTQAKLLRVLEERKVWRLGSLKPIVIDVRIVAATNRDLQKRIAQGSFRADLFYRLNGLSLTIPPLRERVDEIEPLATLFAQRAADALRRPPPGFSIGALDALRQHHWPGNIRELRNAVERAVLLARDGVIEAKHLPDEIRHSEPPMDAPSEPPVRETSHPRVSSTPAVAPPPGDEPTDVNLQDEMERLERARIVDALEQCHGNQTRAAKLLGITRRMLISRLERYDIPRPRAGRKKKAPKKS